MRILLALALLLSACGPPTYYYRFSNPDRAWRRCMSDIQMYVPGQLRPDEYTVLGSLEAKGRNLDSRSRRPCECVESQLQSYSLTI